MNGERRLWSRKSQGKQQAKAGQGKGGGKESNEWLLTQYVCKRVCP